MKRMRRLFRFLLIAALFEVIAIPVTNGRWPSWLMDIIVGLAMLYFIYIAVRGWRKQTKLDLPPVMSGKVVRKRHWTIF